MATMPNVVGLEWAAAFAAMVSAGARVVPLGYFQPDPVFIVWKKSAATEGTVTAQAPIAGASISPNGAAVLTVSAPPVSVANFGGLGS